MWLTKVSILRPVTITMVIVAIVVLGLFSRGKLPVDLYPKIDIPWVSVTAVYPGTGPQEIETLISKPLEDSVSTITGVKNVTSTSEEGLSRISIEFYLGTDLNTATNDVREKVDSARLFLPRDMDPPVIEKFSFTSMPVFAFALSSPRPPKELRHIADDVIKDRLGKLKGVGAVLVAGGDIREIEVAVDKSALEGYGLTINDITTALQMSNLNLPSGSVKEERREYAVRAVGEFQSPEEIRDVRVSTRKGATIRLADIARVADTVAERRSYTRVNGSDSVALTIMKQSDANTVQVCDAARNELVKLTGQTFDKEGHEIKNAPRKRSVLSSDIDALITMDNSAFIRDTQSDLWRHLTLGSFFAVLVVFLFLHNLRGTFIVALAIPTSIIATFIPMLFSGFTMNMMTMLGLSLCVGILVDDSIVVIENIYRHLRKGEEPHEAAFNGRTEIGLAAITITLVDVVVFVPIAFMGGMVGQFFRQFGLTVAMATLFSLFVSFTLTPMLSSRWFRRLAPSSESEQGEADTEVIPTSGFFRFFDRVYKAVEALYRRILAWALDHRLVTVLIGVVSLITCMAIPVPLSGKMPMLSIIAFFSIIGLIFGGKGGRVPMLVVGAASLLVATLSFKPFGFEFFPRVDEGNVSVSIELPAGSSLVATDSVVRQLETFVLDKKHFPEVESVYANVGSGIAEWGASTGASYGGVRIVLVDKTKRKRSDLEIVAEIDRFARAVPGAVIKVSSYQGMGGGGGSPISIELSGNDMNELIQVAERVKRKVAEAPGAMNVDTTWKVGKPEIRAEIDRDRAADRGVSTFQVANALRTSLEGDTTAKYREGADQYDIRVRLKEFDRSSVNDVSNLLVGYNSGPIYLGDIADVSPSTGPTKIDRKNRQRMVAVQSDLQWGSAQGNVVRAIEQQLSEVPLGNVSLFYGGESEVMRESFGNMFVALLLSVVLIYILQAALFEGYLSPFIIMFALPMAMVGALLAIIITGKTLSIITMIGIIMLMGLVGKNAILLVDYTNTLRSRGRGMREALLEAGPVRLRPILMTTLAMVFGMLPIALAVARGGEARAPMAIAVIGGLILSTMLTLLVIPVLYTVFDTLAARLTNAMRRAISRIVP